MMNLFFWRRTAKPAEPIIECPEKLEPTPVNDPRNEIRMSAWQALIWSGIQIGPAGPVQIITATREGFCYQIIMGMN